MRNPFTNARLVEIQADPEEYHKQLDGISRGNPKFVMSRSDLMSFALCPHRWLNGYEAPDSKARKNGSLQDCLVLDPDRFEEKYAIAPETYENEKGEVKPWNWNANVCKAWRDEHEGQETITKDQHDKALTARDAIDRCDDVASLITSCQAQVRLSAEYHDAATQLIVPIKVLIDLVPLATNRNWRNSIGDFKTARSANPGRWAREVFNFNYDAQAAMNLDVYNAATGNERIDFFHVVQENVPPYEVLVPVPILSSEFLDIGRMKYLNALAYYCQSLKSGKWPSYSTGNNLVMEPAQIIYPQAWMVLAGSQPAPNLGPSEEEGEEEIAPAN